MRQYKIYKNGEHINTIVGSAAFVSAYCVTQGLTYEEEPLTHETPAAPTDPQADMAEMLVNLTYELELLKQQMGVV